MKYFLIIIMMLLLLPKAVSAKDIIISTDSQIAHQLLSIKPSIEIIKTTNGVSVLRADEDTLIELSKMIDKTNRCGGYFVHDSVSEAIGFIVKAAKTKSIKEYKIHDSKLIKNALLQIEEKEIIKTIKDLEKFHNRYYTSESGANASEYIRKRWSAYSSSELFPHAWLQSSVIGTIKGSKYPDEIIIIGGHLDSIAGFWNRKKARAPGADDNASGIAVVTEVLRVLDNMDYKPTRTFKFMAYAAEEVGLRGSKAISEKMVKENAKVIGVMQLDMTNYKGSKEDIHLTTDYTDAKQTEFLKKLIDRYVKATYAETKCGYACSDHASWTKAGYPAVFPFEAAKGDVNKQIHTKNDTLEVSGNSADHAVKFAKLALAYILELDIN